MQLWRRPCAARHTWAPAGGWPAQHRPGSLWALRLAIRPPCTIAAQNLSDMCNMSESGLVRGSVQCSQGVCFHVTAAGMRYLLQLAQQAQCKVWMLRADRGSHLRQREAEAVRQCHLRMALLGGGLQEGFDAAAAASADEVLSRLVICQLETPGLESNPSHPSTDKWAPQQLIMRRGG